MIEISKNESIVDILNKMSGEEQSTNKEVILQFPFGHPVLHNYISLKILLIKAGKKKLIILTNDKTSKKIGKGLGIIYKKNGHENEISGDEQQQILLKENVGFGEYALLEVQKYIHNIKDFILQNKNLNSIHYERNRHKGLNKNIIVIIILIFLSVIGLLLYIYYFAINKTIIEISPEISIKTKARNYVYKEIDTGIIDSQLLKNNEIELNKVSKSVNIYINIPTSGIGTSGSGSAYGIIEVHNLFADEVQLLPNTKFVSKDGIIFSNPEMIEIPGASGINKKIIPGVIQVKVFAEARMENGDVTGRKGNIGTGILLTIPKLGEDQTKIFGKTLSSFTGGTDNFSHFLQKDDIEHGKKIINETLKQNGIKEIKKQLSEENKKNNTNMQVLGVDAIYKFSSPQITIPDYIKVGDEISEFPIKGSIEVVAYYFNQDAVVSKMRQVIYDSTISDFEKIIKIENSSLRIPHILSRNDQDNTTLFNNPLSIKATTEIEYYVSKNFGDTNNNYLDKLRYEIAGMDIEEAQKVILNSPYINNVEIKVEPFFLKKVSKIPTNIEFKINE